MLFAITSAVSGLILSVISVLGYAGIFILMILESADIPIPSEIVLPFAGFLVYAGQFNDIIFVALIAALGNLAGSLINYWIAYRYEHQAIAFLERWYLASQEEMTRAYGWFKRRGLIAVFLGRMLPVVRTFISFPAGMFKVNLKHFAILTFIGSFIWCTALTYIGYVAGYNWVMLEPYFRQFDYLVVAVFVILFLLELNRRFRKNRS